MAYHPERKCAICEVVFRPKRKNGVFCSEKCRQVTKQRPFGTYAQNGAELSSGTSGAISELRVCADLLSKGYEVFRAVSASCSCDLAILKDGQLKRIEVRTGYIYKPTGKVYTSRPKTKIKFDVFAICLTDRIIYEPTL